MIMDKMLNQLYDQLWPEPSETELRVMELRVECADLEQQLLDAAETLPYETKALVDSYILTRAELEIYSLKQAFQAGRKIGGHKEYYYR